MSEIEISVLKLPHAIKRWDLVYQYLALRKDVFVSKKRWSLSGHEQYEYEQYDGGTLPHYVICHKGNEVLAGMRLLRCDQELGHGHDAISYMIRDAHLGRIDLPAGLWVNGEPPTDSATWEVTRFVSVTTDQSIAGAVLHAANSYMKLLGGKQVLFLSHPALVRLVRRHGFHAKVAGPVLGNGTGRFVVSHCSLI